MTVLVCPNCTGSLVNKKSVLECKICKKRGYKYISFIDFLHDKPSYYWGEISQTRAKKLISDSIKLGFNKAVHNLETESPGMSEYILSYSRADWIYSCMDFSPGKKALDIGSGWGAITFSLSHHLDEVWSLESVKERIEFQRIRARQENRSNIHFVRSTWAELPFEDESFDLIVINGVLEWIGLSDFSKNPRLLQQQFLSELYRILKPGGKVYIGIENRYALFLFFGSLDHSGLPFTSLMPRWMADITVRKFRKNLPEYTSEQRMSLSWPDYRTYTYTSSGYSKLLRSVGFSNIDFNWVLSYNSPTESGNFDGESFGFLMKHFREHDFSVTLTSKLATLLGPFVPGTILGWVIPFLSPNYLIFATKGERTPSFEDKLLKSLPGSTSFVKRSGTHGIDSRINYFLLAGGRPAQVVKFSRFKKYTPSLKREEELLSKWNNLQVKSHVVSDREIFVEPFIQGKICRTLSLQDNQRAIEWLLNFQRVTNQGNWVQKDFINFCGKNISVLDEFKFSKANSKTIHDLLKNFLNQSKKLKIPIVSEHGDYVKTNIIINSQELFVLDWEFFSPSGSPLFDFLVFVINQSRVGGTTDAFINNLTGTGKYSHILKRLFEVYSARTNLPISFIVSAIPFSIVRSLARRFNDSSGKHLDTKPLLELLNIWCTINSITNKWLTS